MLIFTSGRLEDDVMVLLMDALNFQMSDVDFSCLSEQLTDILITSGKVAFSKASLDNLKIHFPKLAAFWIGENWKEFIDIFEEVSFTTTDWANLLKKDRANIDDEQERFLLERLPETKVTALLMEGVTFPGEILLKKNSSISYSSLEELVKDSKVNRDNIALILSSNLGVLNEDQVKQILSDIGGEYDKVGTEYRTKVRKSDIIERLLRSLQSANLIISDFEIKNKYIHVTYSL